MNTTMHEFYTYLSAHGLRRPSVYIPTLKEYFQWLEEQGNDYVLVTEGQAVLYRQYLVMNDKQQSRGTINNKLCRVRKFYQFLVKRHAIARNPFAKVGRLKSGNPLPKTILTVHEIGVLLDSFALKTINDIMVRTVIEIMYGSGIRVSEAATLRLHDIDYDRGWCSVIDHKGGKKRKVPMTEASLRWIKKYMQYAWEKLTKGYGQEDGYLFPQKGTTMLRCIVNRALSNECKRLGLKRITSHSLRHSVATHLLQSKAGIREVQEFLGHKKIGTTQIYTRVVTDDLKQLLTLYHPREQESV